MDNDRKFAFIVGLLIFFSIVTSVSAYMGYRALSLSRQTERDLRTLQTVQAQLDRLTAQMVELQGKKNRSPEQMSQGLRLPPPPALWPDSPPPPPHGPLPKDVASLKAPKPLKGDAPLPPPLPGEPANSPEVAAHRKDLIERNASLHRADQDKYGNRIDSLYNAARNNPASSGGSQNTDTAFEQLLTEFPEANATGMVISERALESALKANTPAAEEYYKMLTGNEEFASLVTDSGVEVMPALQGYLAYQYIQQSRFSEVEPILQSLEANGSGLVAVPGPRGEPEWRSVSEVVQELRAQMNTSGAASN